PARRRNVGALVRLIGPDGRTGSRCLSRFAGARSLARLPVGCRSAGEPDEGVDRPAAGEGCSVEAWGTRDTAAVGPWDGARAGEGAALSFAAAGGAAGGTCDARGA